MGIGVDTLFTDLDHRDPQNSGASAEFEPLGIPMLSVMQKSADAHGWTFAEAHRKTFVGRGLCAGHTSGLGPLVDDLRLPRRHDGVWKPYNPVLYQPYASRLRWFRTPNDAFLTAHTHREGVLAFDILQPAYAGLYSGAIHPTAEAHAIVADYVIRHARGVIDKPRQVQQAAQ